MRSLIMNAIEGAAFTALLVSLIGLWSIVP